MLNIISYNVNGLRAAMTKGFVDWVKLENPDVLCLQEIKVNENQIDLTSFHDLGYYTYLFSAEKKGYSGVAIFSKLKPNAIVYGVNNAKYDAEGRTIRLDFDNFSVVSLYLPSGTTGDIRQTFKYECLDFYHDYFNALRSELPNLIVAGDYNICHEEIDIHNPKSNVNSSGFLPEERQWFTKFLNTGWIDSFRHLNKEAHHYSWWTFRAGARANNKGWRIDYHIITESLKPRLLRARILPTIVHSDHCPVKIEIAK